MARPAVVERAEPAGSCVEPRDDELVARCRAGDVGAFGVLVARHQDVVLRVAARIVGADESADVAQDTFLRAFHRLDRFRGESTFRAWVLGIARNSALDALAARRRRPAPDDTPDDRGGRLLGVAPHTPAHLLDERERRERLRMKLQLLSPRHRDVLVLRELEGLSYDEIAEATQSPLGSVKGRLHRARDELAELLRANAYDWELP